MLHFFIIFLLILISCNSRVLTLKLFSITSLICSFCSTFCSISFHFLPTHFFLICLLFSPVLSYRMHNFFFIFTFFCSICCIGTATFFLLLIFKVPMFQTNIPYFSSLSFLLFFLFPEHSHKCCFSSVFLF